MIFRIITRSLIALLFFGSVLCFGANKNQLQVADSLFAEEKYTEAMETYQEFFIEGKLSPAMLLKMAYVADATGDYANALYYLDLYYQKSGDRLTVGKIEELAEANGLYGYNYSDADYLIAILSKYKIHLSILFLGMLVLLLAYSFKKVNQKERPYAALIIQSLFGLLLLFLVNFNRDKKAIVVADQSLLRSGPSAGAEPVKLIEKGHKVTVIYSSEIWSKILWEGDEVFIRNSRLKAI